MLFTIGQRSINMCDCISSGRPYSMGLAMILIMLFHMGIPYFSVFGHWGVDIFMFVSGFGIYYSLHKTSSLFSFYKRRLVRIMPATVLFGIVIVILNCLFNRIANSGFGLPYGGDYVLWGCGLHLWYIRSLVVLYLLSPFLYSFIRLRISLPFFICIVFFLFPLCYALQSLAQILPPSCRLLYVMTSCWTVMRFPSFFCGMIVACYGSRFKSNVVRDVIIALFLMFLALGIRRAHLDGTLPGKHIELVEMIWHNTQYLFLIPIVMFLCVGMGYMFSRLSEKNILSVVLRWLGSYSLEIYVVHEAVYGVLKKILSGSCPISIYYIAAISFSLLLALLLNRVCCVVVRGLRLSRVRMQC